MTARRTDLSERIAALIGDEPMTKFDVALALGICDMAATAAINGMVARGVLVKLRPRAGMKAYRYSKPKVTGGRVA